MSHPKISKTAKTGVYCSLNGRKVLLESNSCLPKEILFEIFVHLDGPSLCAASEVCRMWRAAAADKRLWIPLYNRYTKAKCAEFSSVDVLKYAVIEAAIVKRNAKCSKMRRHCDPLSGTSGLHKDFIAAISPMFRIEWFKKDRTMTGVRHGDVFTFKSSVHIRFYFDNHQVKLGDVTNIKLKAHIPAFGSEGAKGPTHSLTLLEMPFRIALLGADSIVEHDDLITLYRISDNIAIAFWSKTAKSGGGTDVDGDSIAFVTVTIHAHKFVERCLSLDSSQLLLPPAAKPLSSAFSALINEISRLGCFIEMRNARESFWIDKLTPKVETDGSSATLILINRDSPNSSWAIMKDCVDFLWKTELFKGRFQNLCYLDFVLLDTDNNPVHFFSSLAKFSEITDKTYDYSEGKMMRRVAADSFCQVTIEIFQDSAERKFYIRHVEVRIFDAARVFEVKKVDNKDKNINKQPKKSVSNLSEDMAAYVELYNEEAKRSSAAPFPSRDSKPTTTASITTAKQKTTQGKTSKWQDDKPW